MSFLNTFSRAQMANIVMRYKKPMNIHIHQDCLTIDNLITATIIEIKGKIICAMVLSH